MREDPQSDWSFCPSDPRTSELQFDLYRDALEAFPYGKYLHIGGDEVSGIGTDNRCVSTGKTPFELQMEWLRRVCKFATDHGRTPIFWDDMPLKHAGIWGLFWNNLSNKELDKVGNIQKLDDAVELNKHDMLLCARLVSPQKFIIHPSAEPIGNEERDARISASRKSLEELAPVAKELNIALLVENLPRTCLGNTSAELLAILDGIENTAICFDVNHRLIESHASFIQNTKGKIQSTHMSDYDRKNERHWLPGERIIDWNELLRALVESGYQGPFIYEASKGKEPDIVSIRTLGDRWKKLKKEYAETFR